MIVTNIAYRFWLPSQNKLIYPQHIFVRYEGDGTQRFFIDGDDLSLIDKDFIPMLKSPFLTPSGEIFEGDVILYRNRTCNVFVKEDKSNDEYELYNNELSVDFFIQLEEGKELDLGEINLEKEGVEIIGDIYTGVFYESDFSKEVDRIKEEKRMLKIQAEKASKDNKDEQYQQYQQEEQEEPDR